MSYSITLTNGTVKTIVGDGTFNQTATDLTLIGKNVTGYGEFLNDNFVRLLENFANISQPNFPIVGQIWYDTSENKLKVYNGSSFVPTSSTLVSDFVPSSFSTGDLWISSSTGQLFFNDGASTKLAGPVYTNEQGLSGFATDTILDTNGFTHTVVYLYVGQSLLGIFAKEVFTPAESIVGFTGSIKVGFNASSYSGMEFHTTATNAQNLIGSDGTPRAAAAFVSAIDDVSLMTGQLQIQSGTPLILGALNNTEVRATNTEFAIESTTPGQKFNINLIQGSTLVNALTINPTTGHAGIFNNSPQATLDVTGTAIISSNTQIKGVLQLGFNGSAQAITTLGAGNRYQITSLGNSDFTLIGSSANTVGTKFTATGAGVGTGTASLIVTSAITGLTDPVDINDAATKNYVDTRPLAITIPSDTTSTIATTLAKVFPVSEHPNLTIARVVSVSTGAVRQFQIQSGTWTYVSTL